MEKNFEVGDRAKIISAEGGWCAVYGNDLGKFINQIGVVWSLSEGEVALGIGGSPWHFWFPYSSLEKVEDDKTPKHVETVKQEEKKLTNYSVFTTRDCGEEFFFFAAISKEENNESIIFTEENGGTWEFYKKHIVAIKKA